jgi:hypothetical protein
MDIKALFRRLLPSRKSAAATAPVAPPPQKVSELERLGEEAYDRMYDSRHPSGDYSEAKECFHMAIQQARELGREDEVQRLEARLQHIKDVFRSQFS